MENKKFTPLMTCHLILMVLLAGLSLFISARTIAGLFTDGFSATVLLDAIALLLCAVSLIFGILYLANGYSKAAAGYYKGFLVLTIIASLLSAITDIQSTGFGFYEVVTIIRIFALFVLAFWKDLGRYPTWIVFYLLLAADIAACIMIGIRMNVLYAIAQIVGTLLIDGTIGLSIRGKYADKDARKTR